MSDHLFVSSAFQKQLDGVELVPPEFGPGLYDSDKKLKSSWEKLIQDGKITVESNVLKSVKISRSTLEHLLVISPTIKSIGSYAFEYEMIQNISIPSSVTELQGGAFFDVGCENIELENGLITIGQNAISCRNVTNIIIPDTVTSIGEGAFSGCGKLREITIPKNVVSVGENAFNCKSLERAYYDGKLSPNTWWKGSNGVKVILIKVVDVMPTPPEPGFYGFGTYLWDEAVTYEDLYFDNKVLTGASTSMRSFDTASIKYDPDKFTTIRTQAFDNCYYKNVYIPKEITVQDNCFPSVDEGCVFYYDGSLENRLHSYWYKIVRTSRT